jgi:pyruvate formate-lyase/glycerol dehydratase family glycyl radical enzyme
MSNSLVEEKTGRTAKYRFKKVTEYTVPSRIKYLKDSAINTQPEICIERARIYTDVYKRYDDEPLYIKRALALKETLENMTIFIVDNELIVGNQAFKMRAAPVFPEYSAKWIADELDEFEKRPGDKFLISEDKKEELKRICAYWEGKTVQEKAFKIMPREIRMYYDQCIIMAEGNITAGTGHVAVDYEKVLSIGLKGVKEQVRNKLEILDLTDYKSIHKRTFYRGTITVLDACIEFAKRYSKLAAETAEKENDQSRKKELLDISRVCAKVPEHPAESFYEALQSIWFIQLMIQIESNGHSISFGRLDQYLYKYFRADIDAGVLNHEQAMELFENLWIKMFCINKLRPWFHTRFSPGSPLYQNVTIGGQTRDGKDATNDLTRLILLSVGKAKLPQPLLTPRLHKGTPDGLLNDIIDVINLGFGMPALLNDEIIIPQFLNLGIDPEEARDYTIVGCIEPAIMGKWGYRPTGMSFVNLMKILNLALTDGVDIRTGETVSPGCGKDFTGFESFEELFEALEAQILHFTRAHVTLDSIADITLEQNVPDVLTSCLIDDCIEKGKNLFEGGARYDFISGLLVGNANIANALAAIKYLVFDKKTVTKEQYYNAVKNNFEGSEGRMIRSLIQNKPPKYGNDDDYVDLLLKRVYEVYCEEIFKHKNTRCGRGPELCGYYAGTSSITGNVAMGSVTEATPDGRLSGEPFAEGCSPAHGDDRNGSSAVLHSVAKLPALYVVGGVLLNQKYNPNYILNQQGKEKFASMLRTYIGTLKGQHIQFNVVKTETLREAQKKPDKYKDLQVRVAGYSALFTQLSPEIQEDIIGRTEQKL